MHKNKLTDRKKQAIATHQRINRIALRLFNKEGFDRVTVDEICKRAGVSKGTFYVYFNSKQQVILDIFSKSDETYDAYFVDELAIIVNPVEKLWLLGRKALSYMEGLGVDVMQITYRARFTFNKRDSTLPTESRSLYKIVLALVQDAQTKGYMRSDLSSDEVAHMIFHCVGGITHDWCLVNGGFDLVSEGEKVFGVLLKGLRPDSAKN